MYLLDTDVLSNFTKRVPSEALSSKITSVPHEPLFTSTITIGEMVFGAHKNRERRQALLDRIETEILPLVGAIVPFDAPAARSYGEMRAFLERQGMRLADPDLRIAATALSRNFVMVTGNTRHFNRVPGLTVENWL
jgi:tRNA(fMet)-specific endonuclease VapC